MSTIRPTRVEISDRFPVLGFTIKTGGNPLFEVVLTTDPDLVRADHKSGRTPANFFSSHVGGPLRADRGEAVWLVPSEVLKRFAGASKLFYGLATYRDTNRTGAEIARVPSADSPWVNLRGLTGRGSRRMMISPASPRRGGADSSYTREQPDALEWAGDAARPGTEPVASAPQSPVSTSVPAALPASKSAAPAQTAAFNYDDGFGPMPSTEEDPGIEEPIDDRGAMPEGLAYAQPLAETPDYPGASSYVQARHFQTPTQPRIIERIVIHITDGQGEASRTADFFRDPMHWLAIDVDNGELQMEMEGGRCKRFRYKNRWQDCIGGRTRTQASRTLGLARVPVSAHYAVGQAGEVVQMVRNTDIAYHANSANRNSIGIEHNARAPRTFSRDDTGLYPSDDQYRASARLVCWLASQYNIPKDRQHILGHSEADPHTTHTNCPNAVWDWDRYMALLTDGSCDPVTPTAQGLSFHRNQARALDADVSYDVALIPQPNKLSCWAASMAMLVSFRRQASFTPENAAQESGCSLNTSYGWEALEAVREHFGFRDIQLPDNASLYYPPEQWQRWLNDYGPLWVTTIGAPSHAIIVRGIHGDLTPDGTTVDILNPWDINTAFDGNAIDFNPPNNGVAYSRRFDQFASEFGNLDLDHYGRWRVLYLPAAGAPAMASGLASRAMASKSKPVSGNGARRQQKPARTLANQSFTINWDEVELIPQPTDFSCWAAAAAMVVGWRDRISLTPETLGTICNRTTATGLDPAQIQQFAAEIGLTFEYPQSYSIDGFRQLLENYGPLWVGAAVPTLHAIVVTGMYSDGAPDGSDTFIRISDPWDRVVGAPGNPGGYLNTHSNGSRYILSWAAFVQEYEAAATNYASVNLQILHPANTGGRTPNYGRPVAGYAMSVSGNGNCRTGQERISNGNRRAPAPARSISLADSGADALALKEADYTEEIGDAEDSPRAEVPGTAALTNEEIYRILREVAFVDSGDNLYAAVSADREFNTNGVRHFGLGFGLVLFTQESGRLGHVLQLMQRRDAQAFADIVGPSATELLAVTNAGSPQERLQPIGGLPLWSDDWIARFKQLGAVETFQAAQNEEAIEAQFRPMSAIAAGLGLNTDRALAMCYDRVVARGLGGGLRWVVQVAGPLRTATQRANALATLGHADLRQFQTAAGLPATGAFTPETHAALVGALRRQGKIPVPSAEELIARLINNADGPARARLLRLRDSARLQDVRYRLD